MKVSILGKEVLHYSSIPARKINEVGAMSAFAIPAPDDLPYDPELEEFCDDVVEYIDDEILIWELPNVPETNDGVFELDDTIISTDIKLSIDQHITVNKIVGLWLDGLTDKNVKEISKLYMSLLQE